MSKFAVLLGCTAAGLLAGGAVKIASAQAVAPHPGANPAAICTKAVGVTFYPTQALGCFNRPKVGSCHCEDWQGPQPLPSPSPTSSGGSGWSDHALDDQFLAHLKREKSAAKGKEKADLKLDIREFKTNLKANPD